MAALLVDLIFFDDGVHADYLAGTPVGLANPTDPKWGPDIRQMEKVRIPDLEKKNGEKFGVVFIGGRLRMVRKRFYDLKEKEKYDRKLKNTGSDSNTTGGREQEIRSTERELDGMANRDAQRTSSVADPHVGIRRSGPDVQSAAEVPRDAETVERLGESEHGERDPGDRSGSGGSPQELSERTGTGVRVLDQCGVVCIVDFMNVIVRAWHTGQPSRIHAVRSMFATVANVIERLSPEYVVFALDGGHHSRSKLLPGYKADRDPHDPNLVDQIALAQSAIAAIGWPMIRVIGWEADDVVASLVTQLQDKAASIIVCSSDKDLLQLVGRAQVYHPWGEGQHFNRQAVINKFGVRPDQVADYLALCGDKVDCVPGVKGIGEKKAAELLAAHNDLAGILEAARTLRIPGATGKALREQKDAALLSRQLVELQAGIDIYADWQDWPAREPRAGWVDALRSLELGQCVQRLGELLPMAGRVRSGSPLMEFQWEHCVIESLYVDVKPVVVPEIGKATPNDSQAWCETFPGLAELPPDANRETVLKSVYANTWRRRRKDPNADNGWKPSGDHYFVAQLALDGKPFAMPVNEAPAGEKPRTVERSLF